MAVILRDERSAVCTADQTDDACAVPAIIFQRKMQTNGESFTLLTTKLNAVSVTDSQEVVGSL